MGNQSAGRRVTTTTIVFLISAATVLVTGSPAGAIVTRDASGTHTTTPGQAVFPSLSGGLDVDGVGIFRLDETSAGRTVVSGTGSLLSTGMHIISCAHLFTDASGNPNLVNDPSLNQITFNLPGGDQVVHFAPTQVTIHPLWDGKGIHGNDLAIITLTAPVAPLVPRYSLYTVPDGDLAPTATSIKVGYGRTGQGDTGSTLVSGTKRAGLNRYESAGLNLGGFQNTSTMIMYDFDNGQAANDAFGFFFGASGIVAQVPQFDDPQGYGDDEVMGAPGDSGGPTFIYDGSNWTIAGITSFGYSFGFKPNGASSVQSSDIDFNTAAPASNSSFGEFGFDVRLTNPAIQNFIASAIPEPASVGALMCVGFGMLRPRSRN